MGTRNLTMVIHKGEIKIAQYGQWDGYPSGQGAVIRGFLKAANLDHFKAQLEKVKFIDLGKQAEIDNFLKSIGCKDGWMNEEQAAKYRKAYPLLSRDNGAEVLWKINMSKDETAWVHNSTDFAGDSLFCEWGYVIDLDKKALEIYRGFNKKPLGKTQRFKYLEEKISEGEKYQPIRCIKKIPFGQIPDTDEEFVKIFQKWL